MNEIELSDDVISSFKISKVFTETNNRAISSLGFSDCGEFCLATSKDDQSIQVYDAVNGKHNKTIFSKKYGVNLACFTHRSTNILHSSTEGEPIIRYLSLHDNSYIRYFQGHTKPVTQLQMCSADDVFISAAPADSLKLWDLRTPHFLGTLSLTETPLVAIDPQGLVFAVGLGSKILRMFDMKSYEKGPFATFEIIDPLRPKAQWTHLAFSPDGKDIIISTDSAAIYLLDSFDGYIKQTLTGQKNPKASPLGCCFSTDAKYIIGASDSAVCVWRREGESSPMVQIEAHKNFINHIKFNPKYAMMASSCVNTAFWIPDYL